jgi:hypothetical protein
MGENAMNHTIKMCLMGAALTLVACGPGAKIGGGKQGAAEALFAASGPTSGASDRNQQGIVVDVKLQDLAVACRHGGEAVMKDFTLKVDSSQLGANVGSNYDMAYNNCGAVKTDVGVANLNGSFKLVQTVATTTGSASVQQSFKGRITFDGAFNDFLEADIVQSVNASALASGTGAVSVVLKGTLTNASGTYTYDEAVNVTAGSLSVDLSKN